MYVRSFDRAKHEIDLDRLVWDQEYRQVVKRWLNAAADEADRRASRTPLPQSERPAA